jgi:YfiH family protein
MLSPCGRSGSPSPSGSVLVTRHDGPVFHAREQSVDPETGRSVDLGFTRAGPGRPAAGPLDLAGRPGTAASAAFADLAAAFGVATLVTVRQVHGADVAVVREPDRAVRRCDAIVTDVPGLALCVRVADCVPIVMYDLSHGIVGAVHMGRRGMVAGVVPAAVAAMRELGAHRLTAVVGPHVCGGCYEVPATMRAQVADHVPVAYACTTWGTPSVDIGAGAREQLRLAGCVVVDRSACTVHDDGLHSYRRDGDRSGRMAAVVVWRETAR